MSTVPPATTPVCGSIVGYTATGQPLFFLCNDTTADVPRGPVVPDHCLPMGQMSQSLMPCDIATGEIIWNTPLVATDNTPVSDKITVDNIAQQPVHVATVGVLPSTGARDVSPIAGTAGALVALGVALVALQRRFAQ